MQQQILKEHPHSDIKVYVVWFSMLSGDSRQGWDGYLVPDPRATNLWDEKRLVSQTLDDDVEGASQPVCDAYLLYGPDATWGKEPPRPVGTGYTIYGERDRLRAELEPLLGER